MAKKKKTDSVGNGSIRDRIRELRRVPAAELIPNPKNWRKHPEAQKSAMTAVLDEIGYADALLARETPDGLMLIDGHLRAEVTPETEVPVLILDVSEEEADKILATLDPLAGMADTDSKLLNELMSSIKTDSEAFQKLLMETAPGAFTIEGKTDPDEIPDKAPAVCKTGDLWQLGDHRLLCGDSTKREDVDRLMDGKKADMVFTDPPYGVTKEVWDRDLTWDDVEMFLRNSKNAVCVWNASQTEKIKNIINFKEMPDRIAVWRKLSSHSGNGLSRNWQPIFIWRANSLVGWDALEWNFSNPDNTGDHPTQKPIGIIEKFIKNHDSVLDPFLGSGSTLIACEKTGRRCFGIEIDPNYCDVIIKRWEDFTGKKAVKLDA